MILDNLQQAKRISNTCMTLWLLLFVSDVYSQNKILKREFRAVWIATINNIDWPSKKNLSVQEQQDEFKSIINKQKENGFNAVIVQVRSSADAFYKSSYEPWSEWLTGEQGKAPVPFYDPLAFMVKETHNLGMEFHAWVNPFRAISNLNSSTVTYSHITKQKPHWFVTYGNAKFFNPGIPQVREHIIKILSEIVRNYDIEALHFDDYFYPYPDYGNTFNDKSSFYKYRNGFNYRAAWRRNNINIFIESVHKMIQTIKPQIKFGISPFGVWRNNNMSFYGSNSKSGYTSYDHLYADVRLWLQKGWIDYVAPQLYQNIYHKNNPYKTLVKWWSDNTYGKHLYIGHAAYRVFQSDDKSWHNNHEMPNQLYYNRKFNNVKGSIFYNSKSLLNNQGHLRDSLKQNFYKYLAIVPAMAWKDTTPPLSPMNFKTKATAVGVSLSWQPPVMAPDGEIANRYVIYRFEKDKFPDLEDARNILTILPAATTYFIDQTARKVTDFDYCISTLDKLNNESNPSLPEELLLKSIKHTTQAEKPTTILVDGKEIEIETIKFFSNLLVNCSKEYFGISNY